MDELSYQFLPNTNPADADILLLPVAYEKTVSAKTGTASAPEAILDASGQIEYFDEILCWSPMKHMRISVHPLVTSNQEESETLFHARLRKSVSTLPTDSKKLFIALGGEHSITPTLTAERLPPGSTVVFLDAHADLRTSYQGSIHSHACPANLLREQGHSLVMVGVRSLFDAEAERIDNDPSIELFSARDLQDKTHWDRLLQRLLGITGPTWVSIDMDVFDPAYVPGVGTPQPGGLSWYQILDILEVLLLRSNAVICGADILELVPEPSGVSQITAAKLLQKMISFWGISQGLDAALRSGSQSCIDCE